MISVWMAQGEQSFTQSGALQQTGPAQSVFAYLPSATPTSAVSVTMPVRLRSWEWQAGLAPIFDMNLPEGALRDRIQRRFATAIGRFEDIDLLAIVGRAQIGRLRYTGFEEALETDVPFQSIDEILRAKRSDGLFDYLMEQFAQYSGLAGVQPKVLVQDKIKLSTKPGRQTSSIVGATHIVKMWDPREFPQLAANEYFCLLAAKRLGLEVPDFALSEGGDALVLDRFDIGQNAWLGFEDFCALNGLNARRKYDGSIETGLFKRLVDFTDPGQGISDLQNLYRLIVLNCALGNGDAHLKNFGLLYETADGPARLAPVYDLVTTTAYLPADQMALTLDGSTRWPTRVRLMHLGRTRAFMTTAQIKAWMDQIASVLMELRADVAAWFNASPNPEIGRAMSARWEAWAARSD